MYSTYIVYLNFSNIVQACVFMMPSRQWTLAVCKVYSRTNIHICGYEKDSCSLWM